MNIDIEVKNLTSKDEKAALKSAQFLLNSGNIEMFNTLLKKSEFLFDFVKQNVNKRLTKALTETNYKNLFKFLNNYSPDYEDFIASSFAKYANEDLTDEILELLQNGTENQKTYAAKYFSYIPDTIAADNLLEYAFSDNEPLAFNSAQALGKMENKESYEKALSMLKDNDDFKKLDAVKFLVAYGNRDAVLPILESLSTSSMPENIAGELPFLEPLPEIMKTKPKEIVLPCIHNILSGLTEILPLSQVFDFELYDVLAFLIEKNKTEKDSHIAVILLKALAQFSTICEIESYTFDEDKNTKQELNAIYELLKNQPESFWNEQKNLILKELELEKSRILPALQIISELKLTEACKNLKNLLNSNDEIILCETISAIKSIGKLDENEISKEKVLNKIHSENIKAIILNMFVLT